KPFNFMVGIPGKSFTVAELEAAGVRRISLAGSLYRAAMGGLVAAAHELKDKGTFGYVDTALPSAELAGFQRGEAGCSLLRKMVAAQIHDADDRPEPRQHVGYRHLRTETVRWMKCARSNRKEEQMRNAGVHERCLQPDSIQEFYPVSLSEKSTVFAALPYVCYWHKADILRCLANLSASLIGRLGQALSD